LSYKRGTSIDKGKRDGSSHSYKQDGGKYGSVHNRGGGKETTRGRGCDRERDGYAYQTSRDDSKNKHFSYRLSSGICLKKKSLNA